MTAASSMVFEIVDEMLDMEGDITIGNSVFSRSDILKEMDPIAYRELVNDTADSLIGDLQYDLDRLDPEVDAEEIAEIKERIEDLENI